MKKNTKKDLLLKSTVVLSTMVLASQAVGVPLIGAFADQPEISQPTETNEGDETSTEATDTVTESTEDTDSSTEKHETVAPTSEKVVSETPAARAGQGVVTVNYVNQDGVVIGSNVLTGNVGEEYKATAPMYVDGYAIDITNLPPGGHFMEDGTGLVIGNFTDQPQTITFNYYAETASADINVIDIDENNENLGSEYIEGRLGKQPENFDFKAYLATFEAKGFELAETDYPTDGSSPFVNRDEHKSFTIKLKHKIEVSEDSNLVVRHIKVKDANGVSLENGKYDVMQEHKFTRTIKTDLVNKSEEYGPWSDNDTFTFPAVTLPTVTGYEPSETVPELVVNSGYGYRDVEVKYTPKTVKAAIEYFDTETGKVVGTTEAVEGKYDTEVTVKDDGTLKTLEGKGYVLAENQEASHTVKLDVDGTKLVRVNLEHGKSVKGQTKEIKRTVKFETTEGKEVAKPITQTVTYVSGIQTDLVTGEEKELDWEVQGKDSYDKVEAPEVTGYQSDVSAAPEVEGVTKDTADSTFAVKYEAKDVTATITYFDTFTNEVIDTIELTGKFDSKIPSNDDKIKELTDKGYSVVANPVTNSTFDVDGDKNIQVRLGHQMEDGTTETKEVNRVISMVDEKGVSLKEVKQTVKFTQTSGKDLVTGEVTTSPWVSDVEGFEAVTLPEIDGYTTDTKTIPAKFVTHNDADEVVKVTYTKVAEKPGGEGNGSEGNGSEGNGSEGNGSEGNGSEGNGSEGNGSEGNGSEGNGSEGNGNGSGTTTGNGNGSGTTTGNGNGSGTTTGGNTTTGNGTSTTKPAETVKTSDTAKATENKAATATKSENDPQTGVETHQNAGLIASLLSVFGLSSAFAFFKSRKKD